MFVTDGMLIKAEHNDGRIYIGMIEKIVINPYNPECKTPCGLILMSENKNTERKSLTVEQLKSIEIL